MEESILLILRGLCEKLKSLSESARNTISKLTNEINDLNLHEGKLVFSKLQACLQRLERELNNYFRLVSEPQVDEISVISTIQLEAEENCCELKVKLEECENSAINSNKNEERFLSGKLPKLELPQFEGNILEWHQFWDQFSSNIHNRNLPDVDKLLYLKNSLKGEAARVIEGLDITNKNYSIAIQSLKDRYGKQTQVIDAHYSSLYKITPANRTVSDCRRVLTNIEKHLRVLDSMGENINHNHLRFIVMEKFPEDIIYEMKLKIKQESIEEIRKYLEIIISAREDANRLTHEKNLNEREHYTVKTLHSTGKGDHTRQRKEEDQRRPKKSNYENKQENARYRPTQNKRINTSQRNSENKPNVTSYPRKNQRKEGPPSKKSKLQCIFCEESHYNDECTKFKKIKERKTLLKNRCYCCLRIGHSSKECRKKRECFHCNKLGHNRALCPVKFSHGLKNESTTTNVLHTRDKGLTVLQTAIVTVSKVGDYTKELPCRVLLDSGSQKTYITQKFARDLKLESEEESTLTVFTFGSNIPQEIDSPVVRVQLRTRPNKTITLLANVVPVISHGVPYPHQDLSQWKDKSELADDGSLQDQVDILIGNDYYFSLISEQKIKLRENLYMIQSDFGWILSGKMDSSPIQELSVVTYFQSNVDTSFNEPDLPLIETNMKSLWELESIGITDSPKENREDEAVKRFNETTKYIDNRYSVSWPWIEYPPTLNLNFGMAYGRLVNLLKRLDTSTLLAYEDTLKNQIMKGIIEVVPDLGDETVGHPIHYLPHHGVKVPGKPMRIVYDASSKTKDNKSLNQCLYCGPMMLENLTGLLIKFRCQPIGICADVEKAFLQISLNKQDRDVTRFLWLKDTKKPATEDNLLHLRFTRVPFGVISSPFLLNATIKLHLQNSDNEQVKKLTRDIYVDNLVTGTKTVEEALQLYKNSKEIFNQLSMNLRDWSSNSEEFIKQVSESCEEDKIKILGLNWKLKEDTLQLKDKINSEPKFTKRDVLRVIASIYDPCGFAVPSLLSSKLFIQNLWKEKIKWDTPFSDTLKTEWSKICKELDEVKDILLPRYYFSDTTTSTCQIHCFTDSSTKAYAAVIYIVNDKEVKFVLGKSRLVPLKDQDNLKIPRLELLGVLIGTRLIKYTSQFLQFNITSQTLWTDSQIVIDWCKSDKLLTPFVARRVEEIKRNKNLIIRHVPSDLNPADVATRPSSSKEDREKWLTGPKFVLQHPDSWPSESKKVSSFYTGEGLPKELQESTMDTENTFDEKSQNNASNQTKMDIDTSKEKNDKIRQLMKLQAEHFPKELEGKETSLKINLGLFLDVDGLLRCKGRLKNTDWSYDQRYPILIPKDCDYTNKVIIQTHSDNYHVGVNHTLAIIRQNFWIPHGKRQVQKIIKKCPRCQKHGGGPFKLPPTPALPTERVNYTSPFTFTGLDYMGPVLIKHGNETCKRWIALFTCLAVRAVHLEVVQDLTAEEGLHALRRMISTRGVPQIITSDNATNFKLISEILTNSYCIKHEIRWRFIPQLAPWFGGFYERLIGIVKNCMRRTLEKHLLTDSQLITLVKEIEATVNTRPLTCVDSELVHILKPSDFLTMGKCITMEGSTEDFLTQGTTTKSDLIKAWRRGLVILNEFKDMFTNRYLQSLRERYGHSVKEPRITAKLIPKVGQIVQIKGDSKNREEWKVGKITSLAKSSDGLCRVAKVEVGNREFVRSITHLYPLEMGDNEEIEYDANAPEGESKIPRNITVHELSPLEGKTVNSRNTSNDSEKEKEDRESIIPTEKSILEDFDNVSESTDTDRERIFSQKVDEPKTVIQANDEVKQRRGAATRALEKIAEWTRSLLTLL